MDKEKRYVAARLVGRALIGRFLKKLGKTPVSFDSFFCGKRKVDKEKRYVAARLVGHALIGRFLKKLGKIPVRFDSFFTEKERWIKKNGKSRHASLGMP